MTEATKIWGVAALAPTQSAAVQAHCFGDCGKISMGGAINDPYTGGLFMCFQASCPHVDEEHENYGETMSFGRKYVVTLRILKQEGKS